MLHHFTWTQFFLATGSCLLLYYVSVALLFYRDDLKTFLEKTTNRLLPQVYLTPPTPETPHSVIRTETIISAVSTQDSPVLTEASSIQVAPQREEDSEADEPTITEMTEPAIAPHAFPMGTLADFLQEIKTLLELVAETQMEKKEFISLLQLIISKYSRTAQSNYQDQVQRFLLEQSRDRLPFELMPDDLQSLWPSA